MFGGYLKNIKYESRGCVPNNIGINSNINFNIFWIMSKKKAQYENMNETSKVRNKKTNLTPKKKKRKK